ncbi:hypothetical protein WR164_00870 [Philodulcilactobacillus myokoensis]|uniref:Thioredoxin domain-containing protein n=1 Tax=Philodulcilactobacillus myokoensis TaxID=2929573 RepID=A0A9W6B0A1_9LACO|nr:hypothetical protein [Philodulcilactobacillus myokoensis]GLB46108.1 hypothetical protein WR164_00870 [Philodulcilactobacillus myokoensis]
MNQDQYKENADHLDERSINVINNRIGVNEHIIVFMGQPNDSKSERIMNNLAHTVSQLGMDQDVFYVNTIKRSHALENFMAKFHLKNIPNLAVYNNGELDVQYQGNFDKRDLQDFLKNHQ